MTSRMRKTHGATRQRRSHHALKSPRLDKCQNCGAYKERHRVCLECGYYRGKQILEVALVEQAPQESEEVAEKQEEEK